MAIPKVHVLVKRLEQLPFRMDGTVRIEIGIPLLHADDVQALPTDPIPPSEHFHLGVPLFAFLTINRLSPHLQAPGYALVEMAHIKSSHAEFKWRAVGCLSQCLVHINNINQREKEKVFHSEASGLIVPVINGYRRFCASPPSFAPISILFKDKGWNPIQKGDSVCFKAAVPIE